MKVGQLEGTTQEIKDLMENHGLNLGDYLEKTEKPICTTWLVVPAILYFIALIATNTLIGADEIKAKGTIGFLFSMGFAIWLTVTIQIRYKSIWTSSFTIFMLLLLSLVSLGAMQPYDLIVYIEKLKSQ